MKISILIPTRNKPELLKECLISIISNDFDSYEILIIDQSDNQDTFSLVNNLSAQNPHLRYIKSDRVGKSRALNIGIRESKGGILAFTDHDCIVDSDWLKNIALEFAGLKKEVVLTGRTLHLQRSSYNRLSSPTRKSYRRKIFNRPNIFSDLFSEVLVGNNIAFNRSVFKKIGFFDESFGPGALFKSCDDVDIGFRVLQADFPIIYSPNITVYHQSWRNYKEYIKQKYEYGFGKSAFYLKYFLKGDFQMFVRLCIWFLLRIGLLILAIVGLRRDKILGHFSYIKGMIFGGIQMIKFRIYKR